MTRLTKFDGVLGYYCWFEERADIGFGPNIQDFLFVIVLLVIDPWLENVASLDVKDDQKGKDKDDAGVGSSWAHVGDYKQYPASFKSQAFHSQAVLNSSVMYARKVHILRANVALLVMLTINLIS